MLENLDNTAILDDVILNDAIDDKINDPIDLKLDLGLTVGVIDLVLIFCVIDINNTMHVTKDRVNTYIMAWIGVCRKIKKKTN